MNRNNLKDPIYDAFNYHLLGNSFFFNGMNFYKEFFFENINASHVYLWPALDFDLLSVEETPPFLPELFGIPLRVVNKTFMSLQEHGCL